MDALPEDDAMLFYLASALQRARVMRLKPEDVSMQLLPRASLHSQRAWMPGGRAQKNHAYLGAGNRKACHAERTG